jgi:hypothetical protein
MDWYIQFVKTYPILSAIIQFALLGTAGEIISKIIISGRIHSPFNLKMIIKKILIWAFLAVCIKYAFIGYQGFTDSLILHNYLPEPGLLSRAFIVSVLMNLQFGLFLVLMHRILDNLAAGVKNNWNNIDKSILSLIWFWIPAHTVTFILPRDFQIGLAALWSLALGIILGFYNKPKMDKWING